MGQWYRGESPHILRKLRTQGTVPPIPLILLMAGCLAMSLLFFEWHLNEDRILIHAAFFYPVNIGLLFALLCFCKLLDHWHYSFVTNLSIGTLVIIGLHIIPIGITNFIVEHQRGLDENTGYHWYEALFITIFIIALLYPIILIAKKHAPMLIGKDKSFNYGTAQTK